MRLIAPRSRSLTSFLLEGGVANTDCSIIDELFFGAVVFTVASPRIPVGVRLRCPLYIVGGALDGRGARWTRWSPPLLPFTLV